MGGESKLAKTQPPTPGESAKRQAQREGLKLVPAKNHTGFFGVRYRELEQRPYKAWLQVGDRIQHLGYHACGEEAALARARAVGVAEFSTSTPGLDPPSASRPSTASEIHK